MERYEKMYNSLSKNIGEFCEFVIEEFDIDNYYDLTDLMIDLHNFRAKTYKHNKDLALKIIDELEKENEVDLDKLPKLTLVEN